MKAWKVGAVVLGVLFVLPGSCGVLFLWAVTRPAEVGVNISSVSWLPKEASDVSYYKTYVLTAYEFSISEDGFEKWAARYGEAKEIESVVRVARFSYMESLSFPEPLPMGASESEWERHEAERARLEVLRSIAITDGLVFEIRESDGGGLTVAYDRDYGRAYFESNPR